MYAFLYINLRLLLVKQPWIKKNYVPLFCFKFLFFCKTVPTFGPPG